MKIAILEDHMVFAESFKTYLELQDNVDSADLFFEIDEFETADSNYDIIILDLDLNSKSSLYLVKKYSELKFLILTANENPKLIKKSYEDGAYGYILKKVGKEKFFDYIKKVVYDDEKVHDNYIITKVLRDNSNEPQKLPPEKLRL